MRYLFFCCLMLISCKPFGDCAEETKDFKDDSCLLIVQKIPGEKDDRFDFRGINPITKEYCDCNSNISDRWWAEYKTKIEIGDTIIKKHGELVFNIHKKDTVLSYNFECDGKIFR